MTRSLPASAADTPREAPAPAPAEPWRSVIDEAFARFESAPLRYDALTTFVEQCLKPVFMAHASGLAASPGIPADVSDSQFERAIGCNRATVRTHLERYFDQDGPGRPTD